MPININFETNLTRREADALRALLDSLHPASGEQPDWEVIDGFPLKASDLVSTEGEDDSESYDLPTTEGEPEASPIIELDSDGKEWDERIHSSSRAKNGDGRWKLKRGVDKALVAQVLGDVAIEDESDGSVTVPDLPTPPVYVTEEASNVPTPPAAAPVPPPPPAPTADTGVPTFPDSVKIFSALGKDVYEKLLAEFGIKSVMGLKDDATRARFFEHESVIVARMEKGV